LPLQISYKEKPFHFWHYVQWKGFFCLLDML
jgi:hypothetical protein